MHIRHMGRAAGLALLFAAVGCNEPAAEPGAISGAVTSSEQAVADATLTLDPGGATALSGADGRYTLEGVAPGTYVVRASAEGYETVVSDDVTVTEGGQHTVDFDLTAIETFASTCESCHLQESRLLASLDADPLPEDPGEGGSAGEG